MVTDKLNRKFEKLRLSVNTICNFACTYCVDPKKISITKHSGNELSAQEFKEFVKILMDHINLKEIRITGGEPTLYKELPVLIQYLKELNIPEVNMTTNAYLLKDKILDLKNAGIDSINISLDSLDEKNFQIISKRNNLKKTINGIEACIKINVPIKLNSTIINNVNDDQILPLLKFAGERGITIRYIELMKMGYLYEKEIHEKICYEKDILNSISKNYTFQPLKRKLSSTANYWITDEGYRFGIIANESSPFCFDCNRLRLDSLGNLYGCLSSTESISLIKSIAEKKDINLLLQKAMKHKQIQKFTGSQTNMLEIGG